MYRKIVAPAVLLITLFVFLVMVSGCQKGSASDGDGSSSSKTTTTTTTPSPLKVIGLDSDLGAIYPGESTQVTATAYDASGTAVSGIELSFVIDDPTLASITSVATTGSDGNASVLLSARSKTGDVTVTASSGGITSNTTLITIEEKPSTSVPSSLSLLSNPTAIRSLGTAAITATVLDSTGSPVGAGTSVTFDVVDDNYGSVFPLSALTNAGGDAAVTFTASNQPGDANITASVGSVSANSPVTVTVLGSNPAAVKFVDVSQSVIAIKGSGGSEFTKIRFQVVDGNDLPVVGETVSFALVKGPEGGEYINEDVASPKSIDVSTDATGYASALLHSGHVAGPVTISASIVVGTDTMSVNAAVVSIGGGKPSMERFDLASKYLNLPGLDILGKETVVTAYLADRFGNYNILDGTTVSFSPESGLTAFSSANTTADAQGVASVTLRTQNEPRDVEPKTWEKILQASNDKEFGTTFAANDGHPRDGLCSVLVYTKGEEQFDDRNGNGYYDGSTSTEFKTAYDTDDDPFCDYNDNGTHPDAAGLDPHELYIDSNKNGVWDGKNSVWDEDKSIFGNFRILITGRPIVEAATNYVSINSGGSATIRFLVCDWNMNPLAPGTVISVGTDAGKLSGTKSHTMADTNIVTSGPNGTIYDITLSDSDPDEDKRQTGAITIDVTWEGVITTEIINVVVDADK